MFIFWWSNSNFLFLAWNDRTSKFEHCLTHHYCRLTKDECWFIPVVKTKKYNTTKSIGTINFRVWNTYFTPLLRPSSSSLLRCWRQQDHGHSDILESYNDTLADNIAGEEEGAAITKQNNRSSEHQASFHHQHLDSEMLGLVWVWLEVQTWVA